MFATPILELAATANLVSNTRDYNIRAQKLSSDEVGDLVTAFNEMLARVQARDAEIRKSLAAREEAVEQLAELNQELQRSNEQLARSNEDLERFAFVASHDLQEPLRMITVYTQLLEKQFLKDPTPKAAEFITIVIGGARRMRELLSDLLAYAEIGAQRDSDAIVDLNVVIEKARHNLGFAIESTHAVITSPALPLLKAYEGHLIPLFQNLIGNAIKYRSEKPPHIRISFHAEDGNLCFAVSDNGIGIAPEYHSKVFIPFKRLHGAKTPGSGIGLAICQRVVERYGRQDLGRIPVGTGCDVPVYAA